MVDISTERTKVSPPDRRQLSTLTKDPKLIRYLEEIGQVLSGSGESDLEIVLQLALYAADLAGSSQGSANTNAQGLQELALLLQSIGSGIDSVALLSRRTDELESQLLDIRPPPQAQVFPVYAPTTTAGSSFYLVPNAPVYQPPTVRASAAAGSLTVALPVTPDTGLTINVKKTDASANAVIVNGNGATIDGSATISIGSQFTNIQVQFNGTSWDVL